MAPCIVLDDAFGDAGLPHLLDQFGEALRNACAAN